HQNFRKFLSSDQEALGFSVQVRNLLSQKKAQHAQQNQEADRWGCNQEKTIANATLKSVERLFDTLIFRITFLTAFSQQARNIFRDGLPHGMIRHQSAISVPAKHRIGVSH
ncbi:MAG: hypothetical protein ACK56I_22195, partial [bacterium]